METLIFRSDSQEKLDALKAVAKALKMSFETQEKPYDPEFVAMIAKGKQDLKDGKGIPMTLEDLEGLCK
ncbi:DUF2683 family protein [Dyadobacter pollutisoli]|jgi:hypothetical protein|uniref:Uncharacterized protein n=1 Tax=Dyadobacter pollutisoli TaxID=2910158 RepID=A0A9E8N6R6_9BACT|nr:DUF2683 family protein [Dyadobacter pollutisoli]WAC10870.1 hypothetical protein ON006_24380 [Dyadobacter pollutisoli]